MQIECAVQGVPVIKNEVLPLTTLFFGTFCFRLRTPYEEQI